MIRFRRLSSEDKEQIFQLLTVCFRLDHQTSRQQLDWRYTYSNFLDSMIAFGAFDDVNKLISFYANTPYKLRQHKQVIETYLCLDMATHPLYRRQQLISQLSKLVYKEIDKYQTTFSIGFSNQQGIKVDKFAKNYGYQIVGSFNSYSGVATKFPNSRNFITPVSIPNFPSKYSPGISIHKTPQYLDWRYISKTFQNYKYLQVNNQKQPLAVVVAKITGSKLYILDLISHLDIDYAVLLRSLQEYAYTLKLKKVTINVLTNSWWLELFEQAGFTRQSWQRNQYYLTIRPTKNFYQPEFLDVNQWRLISGDII